MRKANRSRPSPKLGRSVHRAAHLHDMTVISEQRSPNTIAFSYLLETGTLVTLFKSTPGDTTPRMQMQIADGNPVDCGAVEFPDRFGPYSTSAEFATWVERFANTA